MLHFPRGRNQCFCWKKLGISLVPFVNKMYKTLESVEMRSLNYKLGSRSNNLHILPFTHGMEYGLVRFPGREPITGRFE
jgi:hypothetical protein